jgi:hypothetical protein
LSISLSLFISLSASRIFLQCEPGRVAKIVVACAVLHNIALQRKEPMEEEEDAQGNHGGDEGGAQVPINDNLRKFITDNYFT